MGKNRYRLAAVLAALIAITTMPAAARHGDRFDPLAEVLAHAGGRVVTHASPETGAFDFVRATGGATLSPRRSEDAEAAARRFLERYGALAGMTEEQRRDPRSLVTVEVTRDLAGGEHVRFAQQHDGVPVFGGQLVVAVSRRGVTSVAGHFAGAVAGAATPSIAGPAAASLALDAVAKEARRAALSLGETSPAWYHLGLIRGEPGSVVLAWMVEVFGGPDVREQVVVDAHTGHVLNRIPAAPGARDRVVYAPQYDRRDPDRFVVRREGDPDTLVPFADNLYRFSGQVYEFFRNGFGRDSFDGKGATMRTVALVNSICPNAYWNGATTNYCPGFDIDDVVAHEWGHAYTERTHGLIYQCQSGALNESYSDIWGEAIDLHNGEDGIGGSNNAEPYPNGQRWIVGEDLSQPVADALLRDMWDPERVGDPAKVSSASYVCANTDDNGGVHTNSAIPNLAFASLVDGRTLHGQKINAIGLVRASHLYYHAMAHYQTPTTKFAMHEQALRASCDDLLGVNLPDPLTGKPSGQRITKATCGEVAKAMKAVEMSKPPAQCAFGPMLAKSPPPLCPGATTLFSDSFEKGLKGWSLASEGSTADWPNVAWTTTRAKAKHGGASRGSLQKGAVAYAPDPDDGSCEPGNDAAGTFSMTRTITIPSHVTQPMLRFDHYLSTENSDGANVLVETQDPTGAKSFTPIPASAFVYNPYNGTIPEPLPGGSASANPKAAEPGWFGTDGGEATSSWGTSVVDLTGVVGGPGDERTVRLRFEMGLDCGGGRDGWYIDNLVVYHCPILPPPEALRVSAKGGAPIRSAFTIWWRRNAIEGQIGPDTVQESTICAPQITDDGDNELQGWTTSTEGLGAQPWDTSTAKRRQPPTQPWGFQTNVAFRAPGVPGVINASSYLTYGKPVRLPKGPATLTFNDWFVNEGDDSVRVEVSENGGASWIAVYEKTRSDYAPIAAASFATEPMTARIVNLNRFSGKTINLRFHYRLGPEDRAASAPFGWYVDDIVLIGEEWKTIGTTKGTSLRVRKHAAGRFCFRARTSYRINGRIVPGAWSTATPAIPIAKLG